MVNLRRGFRLLFTAFSPGFGGVTEPPDARGARSRLGCPSSEVVVARRGVCSASAQSTPCTGDRSCEPCSLERFTRRFDQPSKEVRFARIQGPGKPSLRFAPGRLPPALDIGLSYPGTVGRRVYGMLSRAALAMVRARFRHPLHRRAGRPSAARSWRVPYAAWAVAAASGIPLRRAAVLSAEPPSRGRTTGAEFGRRLLPAPGGFLRFLGGLACRPQNPYVAPITFWLGFKHEKSPEARPAGLSRLE